MIFSFNENSVTSAVPPYWAPHSASTGRYDSSSLGVFIICFSLQRYLQPMYFL